MNRWFRGFYWFRLRPFGLSFNEGGAPFNFTVMHLVGDPGDPWFVYVAAFGWRWSWPKQNDTSLSAHVDIL
jgi:hypothetical protein